MNNYYIYIEKERLRVFDGQTCEQMTFDIDGTKTKEIFNTCRFNYDTGLIEYEPLHRSYELNYFNIFTYKLSVCGVEHGYITLLSVLSQMIFILDNLKITTGDIKVIFSYSYYSYMCDHDVTLDSDRIYKDIIDSVNKSTNSNLVFSGCYYMHMLVRGLLDFFQNENKGNVLYIDEKNMTFIRKTKKGNAIQNICWSIDTVQSKHELDENFIKYLENEEIYNSEEDAINLRNFIFHEAKKGKNIKSVVVERRDELREIDCSMINTYLENKDKRVYDNLQQLLFELKDFLDENTVCYLNIRNNDIKEKVIKELENYPIVLEEKEQFIKYIFRYCDILVKYNTTYNKLMAKKLVASGKVSFSHAFFFDKIYFVYRVTKNNKEIDEICKYLGVKSFKVS